MSLVPGAALVTGGGSGIGRAIAVALGAAGAPVAVFDLLPDGGKDTVQAIEAKGGRAFFVSGDVSRWADVDGAVAAAVGRLGPLAIMVNAAGILDGYARVDELTPAVFERVVAINLTGTFHGCKRALAEMAPRGAGRIVNIASVAGLIGDGGGPAYVASKHGVVGLTRALASELGSQGYPGITVNAICPGYVRAGMGVAMQATKAGLLSGTEVFERYYKRLVPQRRMIEAEEIAHAAVFLALPESAGITGQALNIDGGFFMS